MKLNYRNWTEAELELLVEQYPLLKKRELIELFPDKKYGSIVEFARKRGLKKSKTYCRGYGDLSILTKDVLQTYYWIGFIFADGYIHHKSGQMVVASSIEDRLHIDKFANYVGVDAKIYEMKKSGFRSKCGKQVRCSVAHKTVADKIVKKFDFKEQKTYNPPYIDRLKKVINTKEKFMAFFAGFFDGDGTIRKSRVSSIELHASWINVLQFFLDSFVEYGLCDKHKQAKFTKRGYAFSYIPLTAMMSIKEFLDMNKITKMERKWNKL